MAPDPILHLLLLLFPVVIIDEVVVLTTFLTGFGLGARSKDRGLEEGLSGDLLVSHELLQRWTTCCIVAPTIQHVSSDVHPDDCGTSVVPRNHGRARETWLSGCCVSSEAAGADLLSLLGTEHPTRAEVTIDGDPVDLEAGWDNCADRLGTSALEARHSEDRFGRPNGRHVPASELKIARLPSGPLGGFLREGADAKCGEHRHLSSTPVHNVSSGEEPVIDTEAEPDGLALVHQNPNELGGVVLVSGDRRRASSKCALRAWRGNKDRPLLDGLMISLSLSLSLSL